MSFSDNISTIFGKVAMVVDGNKFLSVIKNAFTIYMPFIIVGSFATLFNTILCSKTVGLAQFDAFSFMANLSPAFHAVNFATMSTMTLAIVFIIGTELAKKNNMQSTYCGLLALISFISVVPTSVTALVDDASAIVNNVLPASSMNAQGLFVGMILAILSVEIFSKLMKFEKIKLNMPDTVPGNIATSFNTLIPILLTVLGIAITGAIFLSVTGQYVSDMIYAILQQPMEFAMQSPAGVIVLSLASALFWVLGIHGSLVIMPILSPLALSALANNVSSVEAGGIANNPVTMTFFRVYVVAGGAGITISLIFALLLFSKRDDQKMVAKLGLFPGICGINEPIIFGLPIVLNPIYALPFVLSQVMAAGIAYVASVTGFIPSAVVEVPFGLPILVNAFVGLQTFSAVIVQIVIIVIAFFMYIPFVFVANKQYEREQLSNMVKEGV